VSLRAGDHAEVPFHWLRRWLRPWRHPEQRGARFHKSPQQTGGCWAWLRNFAHQAQTHSVSKRASRANPAFKPAKSGEALANSFVRIAQLPLIVRILVLADAPQWHRRSSRFEAHGSCDGRFWSALDISGCNYSYRCERPRCVVPTAQRTSTMVLRASFFEFFATGPCSFSHQAVHK
jgi:hypothetical protein